jgi:hypothetical protein
MQFQPRRKLAVGAIVLAACSFGGGAYAATQDTDSSSTPQAFLNDVAKRLGVSSQQLTAAFEGALADQLNAAVKAGKLTRAQANAVEQRVRRHGFLPFGLFGPGPRGPLRPGFRGPPGAILGGAAKYLGISTSQLRSELRSGKTLKQIASEHGKSVAGLKQAIRSALPNAHRLRRGPRGAHGPPGANVPPGANGPPGGFGPPAALGVPQPLSPPASS